MSLQQHCILITLTIGCFFFFSIHTTATTKLVTFRDGAGEDLCAVRAERSHSSGMFLHPPLRPCFGSVPDVCVRGYACGSTLLTDPLHPYLHICFNSFFLNYFFFHFFPYFVFSPLLLLSTDFHLPFSNSLSVTTYNHSLPRYSKRHSCTVILLFCVS